MAPSKAAAPRERLVLLDTNALVTAARLRVDLAKHLSEVAPGWAAVVPGCVAAELEGLGQRQHAAGARALAALFPTLPSIGRGDDAVVRAAAAGPRRAVLTNDRALRKRLRERGIPVIYVKGSAGLGLDGAL